MQGMWDKRDAGEEVRRDAGSRNAGNERRRKEGIKERRHAQVMRDARTEGDRNGWIQERRDKQSIVPYWLRGGVAAAEPPFLARAAFLRRLL